MAAAIILSIIIVVLIIVGLMLVFIYNGLVQARMRVREAWSGIDVQLKRRASLIPNLVETVKGYAAHERETLQAVTDARARCSRPAAPARPRRPTTCSPRRCAPSLRSLSSTRT